MKVKINNKERLLNTGFMKVDNCTIEQEIDGISIEYKRICMDRGNAVFIIPYDKERQSVVMVKQSRIGSIIDGVTDYIMEFPAGIIDDGEEAIETAKRELKEETGLDSTNITQLYGKSIYTSIGGSNEKITYFLAEVDSSKALKIAGEAGENEYIETAVIPVEKLFKMVFEEELLNTAATLISIFLLKEKLDL